MGTRERSNNKAKKLAYIPFWGAGDEFVLNGNTTLRSLMTLTELEVTLWNLAHGVRWLRF